jgi:hypothetical protein
MSKSYTQIAAVLLLAAAGASRAQMAVEADPSSGNLFYSHNTGTAAFDGVGVQGESKPAPFYGIGVMGQGGWKGVVGYANVTGTGSRIAGDFSASGGASSNYGVYSYASGGTSSYAGYFLGNVYVSGTFSNPSDPRLKRDIQSLGGALDKVMSLQPSTYLFDDSRIKMPGLPPGRQYGLLSSDVKKKMPELVSQIPLEGTGKDDQPPVTVESVNYMGVIPVLVGAIKEQQAQIAALQAALAAKK